MGAFEVFNSRTKNTKHYPRALEIQDSCDQRLCNGSDPFANQCSKSRHSESSDSEASVNRYKIAVIEGDGIGHEVVPEGLRVLEAAGRNV